MSATAMIAATNQAPGRRATPFFVVPDVLLTLLGLRSRKLAYRQGLPRTGNRGEEVRGHCDAYVARQARRREVPRVAGHQVFGVPSDGDLSEGEIVGIAEREL